MTITIQFSATINESIHHRPEKFVEILRAGNGQKNLIAKLAVFGVCWQLIACECRKTTVNRPRMRTHDHRPCHLKWCNFPLQIVCIQFDLRRMHTVFIVFIGNCMRTWSIVNGLHTILMRMHLWQWMCVMLAHLSHSLRFWNVSCVANQKYRFLFSSLPFFFPFPLVAALNTPIILRFILFVVGRAELGR